MAEQFLEEIYRKAMIIQRLRESVNFVCDGRENDARKKYNQAAQGMEEILSELEEKNPVLADGILKNALAVRDCYDDFSKSMAMIESSLIPLLFQYMNYYTDINVTEGKYNLYSAKTGFLTVRDTEQNITLHNEYDPLWEATRVVRSIYDPNVERYIVLGGGLGYVPYLLWRISEGAARVLLYEEDEIMLSYAKSFGVLDWIEEDALEIICQPDIERIGELFLENAGQENSICYISSWKKRTYKNVQNGRVHILDANTSLERSMRIRTAVNVRKNRKHIQIGLDEIKANLIYKEWIIVSAGPSLDEQISFIRESKGERGIVAVNTVLRRLFDEEIIPDLVVAADQDVAMLKHIENIGSQTEGIPMIAEERVNWKFAELYQGPIYFVNVANGSAERDSDNNWQVSGSVAGLALEAVIRIGAKKVYFVGQDLAYPAGEAYASGMPHDIDGTKIDTIQVLSVDGGLVPTSDAFNWFRIGLEIQIARNKDISFINLSKHGAFIKGCRNV